MCLIFIEEGIEFETGGHQEISDYQAGRNYTSSSTKGNKISSAVEDGEEEEIIEVQTIIVTKRKNKTIVS